MAVPCGDCHKEGLLPGFPETAAYHFDSFECTACHQDPHRGQFRERMAKKGKDGKSLGCLACHNIDNYKDVTKFDHSTTQFLLTGSHRAVACADCHKPPNLEVKLMNVDFKAAPTKCEECHSDIHGAQFAGANRITLCAGCHNTNKWKPSEFDHNTRTAFKLEGVHANVRCARCHTLMKSVEGKDVLFYRPTPKECAACHGANVKG
jgi:nitrate/TMAO reductase-like tetraheme cytochrome c subunit